MNTLHKNAQSLLRISSTPTLTKLTSHMSAYNIAREAIATTVDVQLEISKDEETTNVPELVRFMTRPEFVKAIAKDYVRELLEEQIRDILTEIDNVDFNIVPVFEYVTTGVVSELEVVGLSANSFIKYAE